MFDYAYARRRMVERQLRHRKITDRRVIKAMLEVPREAFVEPGYEEFAYEDIALPITEGQTISQPYIVAYMAEAAEIEPGYRVLEVGGGSGYAAAIFSRLAAKVYVVERHRGLVERARERWARLNYRNIEILHGDGTKGWAEHAPFDSIVVAAGGPKPPPSLKSQLAIGGVLVIPLGSPGRQQLRRIRRTGNDDYAEEDLAAVAFVPLIGAEGWRDDGAEALSPEPVRRRRAQSLAEIVADAATPLPPIGDEEFARAFDRYADRKVVLLGESTHGTSEFYQARAAITRRLIEKHGFEIVAVEADWPDAASVDRFIGGGEPAGAAPFRRFPSWMWRNEEFASLVRWLREHNARDGAENSARFYGLDLYSLSESIASVIDFLDKRDPQAAAIARERYGCLTPFQSEPAAYGRAVLTDAYRNCEDDIVRQCETLLRQRLEKDGADGEALFDAEQNARLVASAERYYRTMYYGGAESWNLRDRHMFETLVRVLERRGDDAKAIVWAHNSHIGDARFTDMGAIRDEVNIGQLCRERFGDEAALIGFGTDRGEVAAADDWGGDMEVKRLMPARADSYEAVFREAGHPCALLDFHEAGAAAAKEALAAPRLERFVGVIYRPDTELQSHYSSASLSRQFDNYVWFDKTRALTPLSGGKRAKAGEAETFPFGV